MRQVLDVWEGIAQRSGQPDALATACTELVSMHEGGTLGAGLLRDFATALRIEGFGGSTLSLAESTVLRLAAKRVSEEFAKNPLQVSQS